ncbi:hypothetical protein WR164_12550 [Philodulcilactobacillus myokoensis]|uniref:S-layer protein n=1 Tax=Philodulcilactobacillus myokoensis TaxID=2929573 RepID=A0A9W6B1W5_9LACO|nr:hypothetical protein [Philodulcilactobacillus myokoensis]GLB47276.1 hypothetical protein WR164_12550 [Philodulcilactobacillus myokoensis]
MQSSLKKSLYLGLAALSFVSVAGAANANNASAKRTHHARVARKAFNPDRQGMDQNQAWQANGKNNIYATILGRNRKLVANGSDIKGQYFMAYQQENNQKGQHYYKVVSFDGKTRGWIYRGGVDKTNTTTDESTPQGTYYLNNTSAKLTNAADGSVFHSNNGVALSHTELVKLDPFKVMKAVKVNNSGDVYYEVADQNQPTVTGWVKSSDMSTQVPFDQSKDVKINLTDQNGNVVKSYNLDTQNYDGKGTKLGTEANYNKVLNFDGDTNSLWAAVKAGLTNGTDNDFNGTSYKFASILGSTNGNNSDNTISNNIKALQYVEPGDTVTLRLPSAATSNVKSHLVFNTLSDGVNNPAPFGANDVVFPKLSDDSYADLNAGQSNREYVGNSVFEGGNGSPFTTVTFANGNFNKDNIPNSLSVLVGSKTLNAGTNGVAQGGQNGNNTVVYNSDADALNKTSNVTTNFTNKSDNNGAYHYLYVFDKNATENANNGKTFGTNLTSYYNVYAVKGAAMSTNQGQQNNPNTDYLG